MKPLLAHRLPSLLAFRASILATMGLAACGGSVSTPGTGGSGGDTGSTTGTTTTSSTGTTTTSTTSTTSTTTSSTTTTTTSSTTSTSTGPCVNPVELNASDGTPSGFTKCADGTIHRTKAAECNPKTGVVQCEGNEMYLNCTTDLDCAGTPNARCASLVESGFGGVTTSCSCVAPCANDAECGTGEVCICAGVVPSDVAFSFCAPASCASDAMCPSGECGITSYNNGCYTEVALACRSDADMCRDDEDCNAFPGTQCVLASPDSPFACLGNGCAIGRPLIVEGAPRTADAMARADWQAAAIAPDLCGLDAEGRALAAAHWLEVAALEHASIASFARFTLELLAIGAPAHLLADAQRAGLDEIEHARIAYAIAGAYAGAPRGPGALDVSRVPLRTDRREIIRSLVVEACVGETLGVAEAIEIAAAVRDPALHAVHARIAADEQRHAELAWRALAWMLGEADDETARFTARCFDEAIAGASLDPAPRERPMPEHGVLASSTIGAIRRRALAEVVKPCASALLARQDRAARAETVAVA